MMFSITALIIPTISTMTNNIMPISIAAFRTTIFSITPPSMLGIPTICTMTHDIMALIIATLITMSVTMSKHSSYYKQNYIQHNATQHNSIQDNATQNSNQLT